MLYPFMTMKKTGCAVDLLPPRVTSPGPFNVREKGVECKNQRGSRTVLRVKDCPLRKGLSFALRFFAGGGKFFPHGVEEVLDPFAGGGGNQEGLRAPFHAPRRFGAGEEIGLRKDDDLRFPGERLVEQAELVE